MKILLYDDTPAYFCHGGKQVLAQKLFEGLRALGVDVEYARWWDPSQECDLIHLFSPVPGMISMAQAAGAKVVLTHIVDRLANLPESKRAYRRVLGTVIRNFLPASVSRRFSWSTLSGVDAFIYLHNFDAEAAITVYGVPREKSCIIPHGCDADQMADLQTGARNARSHLISVASIVPRKNSILLAKAAQRASVPVVFLGKPFSEEDAYYQEFRKLVDGQRVIYPGYVSEEEKERWLTDASGFVLLSEAESGCIAVYEAAAAGLPMLLTDHPWAYSYGKHPAIEYVGLGDENALASRLKSFFAASRRLDSLTFPVVTWEEVARQHLAVYQEVLGVDASSKVNA